MSRLGAFVILCLFHLIACDTINIYISPTGSDTTGNGTQINPYQSITRAIQASNTQPGSTVNLYIFPGTYLIGTENNVFNAPLNAQYFDDGTGQNATLACSGGASSNGLVTTNQALYVSGGNHLTLSGCAVAIGILNNDLPGLPLQIDAVTISMPSGYGILAQYADVGITQVTIDLPSVTPFSFANSDVTIISSSFSNNYQQNNCALLFGSSTTSISDSTFLNVCVRAEDAGQGGTYRTISIESSIFINSPFDTENADFAIDSSHFFSYGETAFTASGGSLLLTNSVVNNNIGSDYGALSLQGLSNVTIVGAAFHNNQGNIGGAIYINGNPLFTVTNSTFFNNTAVVNGSAIYCEFDASYDASRSVYQNLTLSGNNSMYPIVNCPSYVYPTDYFEHENNGDGTGDGDAVSTNGTDLTWLWITLAVVGVLVVVGLLAAAGAFVYIQRQRARNYKEI